MGKWRKVLKNKWKILLIVFFILPCVFAFGGCSCSCNKTGGSSSQTTTTTEYEVTFYTDNPDFFNVPKQTIKEGGKVRPPVNFPERKRDSQGHVYYLNGWYSDPSLSFEYVWKFETDTVSRNMVLYAKWVLLESY